MLWQIVSWFVPPFVIPGWERIFKSLLSLRYDFVLITLARVVAALLISFALGIVLSVAMYLWTPFENYCKPVVRLFMAVPVVCWILFSVLWFKWVEFRIAFVLVVVCAPVFIVDFLDGMKGVQQELRDMLRSFRPSRAQFFTKLLLPAIVPVILTSWKINLSLAIRVVTIAELVGAISGVGYGLVHSAGAVLGRRRVRLDARSGRHTVSRRGCSLPGRGAHAAMADMRTDAADIEVSGLRKLFQQTATGDQVVAIERLDFRIRSGEMVAIVGQTGCGKSTFLNLVIGLDRPSQGRITIGGRAPYDDFDHFRGVLATVFQQDRLLPWRSAMDNVRLPLELLRLDRHEQTKRAAVWLERLGLKGFEGAYPHELSGGMRQRVALARAFVVEPMLLLADEAFGHLDEVTSAALRKTFVDLARTQGNTAIVVTHQLEEAIELGGRILVFGRPGHVLADIDLATYPAGRFPSLRVDIQQMLQSNAPNPEIANLTGRPRQ